MTATDTEVLNQLDFTPELGCESVLGCTHPAGWWMQVVCVRPFTEIATGLHIRPGMKAGALLCGCCTISDLTSPAIRDRVIRVIRLERIR